MTLIELRKSMFGDDKTTFTEIEIRQLMKAHSELVAHEEFLKRHQDLTPEKQDELWAKAGRRSSVRQAAMKAGINQTFFNGAILGRHSAGKSIAALYGLKPVRVYEVVDDSPVTEDKDDIEELSEEERQEFIGDAQEGA